MDGPEPNWGEETPNEAIDRYLAVVSPNTYSIQIPPILAKWMIDDGLVEWIPPQFGTQTYAITEKGHAASARLRETS